MIKIQNKLNKELVELSGLENDDEVIVSFDEKSGSLIISKFNLDVHDNFDSILAKYLDENHDVLEFLKDK